MVLRRPAADSSRWSLLAALSILLALSPLFAAVAPAQPTEGETDGTSSGEGVRERGPALVLERATPSLERDGRLVLPVRTAVTTATPYMEVRFQVMRPSGGVMLQKTEILHDVPEGQETVVFERSLADLGLRPGVYPVRIRVRLGDASGRRAEHVLEDRVILYDPKTEPLPVSVVVRLASPPSVDPEGRFVDDPALHPETRQAASTIATAMDDDGRISLAIAPLLIEQWSRAADGYSVVGPEGLREITAEDPVARSHSQALERIASSLSEGKAELLEVPYAEPDLLGLASIGGTDDLGRHLDLGSSVYLTSLEATAVRGLAVLEDVIPAACQPVLAEQDIGFVVASPRSLASADASVAPGAYSLVETTATVLVKDERLAEVLVGEDPSRALDLLIARHADDRQAPVPVVLEVGPGRAEPEALARALEMLGGEEWLRLTSASEAAGLSTGEQVRLRGELHRDDAPDDYWPQVAEARRHAAALERAAGEDNQAAEDSWYLALMAESRYWAGRDGRWGLADRGRSFSSAALRRCTDVLAKIGLEVRDVTLAGSEGELPLNVYNRSGMPLLVTVRMSSDRLQFPGGDMREVELKPSDNYLTVPVDLRSALSGDVRVAVSAGGLRVAESEVTVKASYLDRVAIVSGVALVLLAMLFFIKRRVAAADTEGAVSARRDDR